MLMSLLHNSGISFPNVLLVSPQTGVYVISLGILFGIKISVPACKEIRFVAVKLTFVEPFIVIVLEFIHKFYTSDNKQIMWQAL